MGFEKKYLKDLDAIKEDFQEKGLEAFVKTYIKVDAFIGSDESITFIKQKIKQFNNQKRDEIS
jgi:spore coat protein CotH